MGKPLLTDEMIERARRGEDITGPNMVDAEETKIIRTDHRGFGYERPMRESRMERPQERYSQDTVQIQVEPTVTKSRRIEERKQSVVQSKLNKILFWIIAPHCLDHCYLASVRSSQGEKRHENWNYRSHAPGVEDLG